MSPSRRKSLSGSDNRRRRPGGLRPPLRSRLDLTKGQKGAAGRQTCRGGFTLMEMMISVTVLSFSAMVFGGLMLAISSAWDHSTSLEDGRRQAQATLSRIKWMVQQSGTYATTGQSTTLGLAVVTTTWGAYPAPTTLCVWSGGTNGGMNALGLQNRLPVASELVVYTQDLTIPSRLVEVTFPGDSTIVDFNSNSFASTIQTLLASNSRQTVLICDRLHVTTSQTSAPGLGDLRFELTESPSDSDIASVAVGSQAWNDLSWGQGLVGADRGLRTTNLRIELLLDPDPTKPATDNGYSTAIPFFGSVNRQYVFQP